MRKFLIVAAMAVLAAGCTNPIEQVRTVDHRPGLVFEGAPDDALIIVDDVSMGSAKSLAKKALKIDAGTHVIVVSVDGTVIHAEKVFVSGSMTKTIKIPERNR
jgi:hypothetical protein